MSHRPRQEPDRNSLDESPGKHNNDTRDPAQFLLRPHRHCNADRSRDQPPRPAGYQLNMGYVSGGCHAGSERGQRR